MAIRGTKKVTKKGNKSVSKLKKLPGRFSLNNPKSILVAALVVGFAVSGSYWMYASSSAAANKDLTTVQGCEASGVVLKAGPNNTVGSTGSCVKVAQTILSFYFYHLNPTDQSAYVVNDGLYGPRTALAVGLFQQHYHLTADGIVGPKTWAWLHNGACIDIRVELHACGDF